MSLQNLPDFDALWDYSHPDQTETKFREILLQFPEDDPAFLELLTQIARAQGLQWKFDHAHQTLDQVERRLGEVPSRPKIRYLLERGQSVQFMRASRNRRVRYLRSLGSCKAIERGFLRGGCCCICWRSSRRPSKA